MGIASASKHPKEYNCLSFCTISFSIDREMNADVVCHSLRLCKQDPGQPLCHLYPPPKVSCFLTSFKVVSCGRLLKLGLRSTEAFRPCVLFGGESTFLIWMLSENACLNGRYTACCWSVSNVAVRKWELQCQPSFYQPGQRQRVDQKNSLSPDFIVKQRNNPQADTQLQFTYTPTLPWHEKLSCIIWSAVTACVGPSFPPQMWGYLTWLGLPWERFKLTCTTFYHRLGMYAVTTAVGMDGYYAMGTWLCVRAPWHSDTNTHAQVCKRTHLVVVVAFSHCAAQFALKPDSNSGCLATSKKNKWFTEKSISGNIFPPSG